MGSGKDSSHVFLEPRSHGESGPHCFLPLRTVVLGLSSVQGEHRGCLQGLVRKSPQGGLVETHHDPHAFSPRGMSMLFLTPGP